MPPRRSLRALEREIGLALDKETRCCCVSTAQCHFLLESADRPNASLSELAEALSLDSSTLSRTADGLLRAGFIRRETDPANRRKVFIHLDGDGLSKVDSINERCDDSVRRLFAYIPEGKQQAVFESVGLLAEALRLKRQEERDFRCSGSSKAKGEA